MRHLIAYCAIAVLAAGAVPTSQTIAAPALSGIRPGERVGAVQLGMTVQQVQQAIGAGPTARDGNWLSWERQNLAVLFDRGVAVLIYTEDPNASTTEGVRLGSTDADLIKAFGAPLCSSLLEIEGKASLAWVYRGLFVFLGGIPRKVSGLAVLSTEAAQGSCR